jgi:hypothetical protein
VKMGLVAGVFFSLQLASLRISWDLLRNILGLGILLFAFAAMKSVGSWKGLAAFSALSLLTVFAHEYAIVILLTVVIGSSIWDHVAKRGLNREAKLTILGIVPASSVFIVGLFLRFFPIHFVAAATSQVLSAHDTVSGASGKLFFMVNYLSIKDSVDSYSTYFSLALSVGFLFAVLYVPYIYSVVKGFFKNHTLSLWTGLLLVGAFSCLVVPFFALQYWHRWMFMLVYPFTFYAVYGLSKILPRASRVKVFSRSWFRNTRGVGMVTLTILLGTLYLATPVLSVYANTSLPTISQTSHYFSIGPNVPIEDVGGTVQAIEWLNTTMGANSCVILHSTFLFWGELYLRGDQSIVTFSVDPNQALQTALAHNFSQVYFVWWTASIGWYSVNVPTGFATVQSFDRMSVFVYGGN